MNCMIHAMWFVRLAPPLPANRVAGIAIAKNYRGAAKPSDHVLVTATLEV